jgi:hypothetical protein
LKTLFLIMTLAALFAANGWAMSIGLYADPNCGSTQVEIGPGGTGTIYICVADASQQELCGGFDMAEFLVRGVPAGWFVVSTPVADATTIIGDPFAGGTDIAFGSAKFGPCCRLFTVELQNVNGSAVLEVVAHSRPSNPTAVCPFLRSIFCDGPYCVPGGSLYVNTTVGVAPSTWTAAKELYQ